LIPDDLWGYVSWSSTLFPDDFTLFDEPGDTKITDFDSEVIVKENIIQFYVPV